MDILKVNDVEYNMTQPTNDEFIKQYVNSFGDTGPEINVNVNWTYVDGFYLHLMSDSDKEFDVEIYDNKNTLLYKSKLFNDMFCSLHKNILMTLNIKYIMAHF
jgi:hypothetical protein